MLGRLMVGGQSSLELGFAVGIATTVVGLLYGAISGMAGGIVDALMMRIVDTLLAVPTFILLIIVASMFSLSLSMIIVILTALSWPYTARLIRGQVLALRPREFVQAARTMGATSRWILARHMVPNTLGISVVTATFVHRRLDLRAVGAELPRDRAAAAVRRLGHDADRRGQQPVQRLLVAGVPAADRAGPGRGGVPPGRRRAERHRER